MCLRKPLVTSRFSTVPSPYTTCKAVGQRFSSTYRLSYRLERLLIFTRLTNERFALHQTRGLDESQLDDQLHSFAGFVDTFQELRSHKVLPTNQSVTVVIIASCDGGLVDITPHYDRGIRCKARDVHHKN